MTSVVVIAPSAPVLSAAEVRAHAIVDHDDDNALIEALIAAASAHLSGPSGWLGRALGEQTLEWRGRACGPAVTLPFPPFINLVSAKYLDPNDVEQPIDLGSLTVTAGVCRSAVVSGAWPAMSGRSDALRIRYQAGYAADDPEFTPIRLAMLMLVSHWYRNREAVGDPQQAPLPFAVEALLSPLRIWSL